MVRKLSLGANPVIRSGSCFVAPRVLDEVKDSDFVLDHIAPTGKEVYLGVCDMFGNQHNVWYDDDRFYAQRP